jgi:signal transduction histidine kinase
LNVCADKVELNISDNGCGFDPSRRKSNKHWGLGLLGMHERAASIGGVAAIESSVGKGTRVSVTLPRDPKE